MDAMIRMDQSVEAVVHDMEIILQRTRELKKEIGALDPGSNGQEHLLRMNELLADMQARIEGVEAFVQACQKRAHRDELPAEDIDLWM